MFMAGESMLAWQWQGCLRTGSSVTHSAIMHSVICALYVESGTSCLAVAQATDLLCCNVSGFICLLTISMCDSSCAPQVLGHCHAQLPVQCSTSS
jgi:hypothetical protein